uniref:ATP-dependent DNA helicase n=1 Tax=Steinernema glaseri TaxID=37863 RepID=A0A1I8A2E9_9BILA
MFQKGYLIGFSRHRRDLIVIFLSMKADWACLCYSGSVALLDLQLAVDLPIRCKVLSNKSVRHSLCLYSVWILSGCVWKFYFRSLAKVLQKCAITVDSQPNPQGPRSYLKCRTLSLWQAVIPAGPVATFARFKKLVYAAIATRMLGMINNEYGIFVLVGDADSQVLNGLRNIQVITNMPVAKIPKAAGGKKAKKKGDDDDLNCRLLGNLKNKYYQAVYNIYKMDKFQAAVNWLGKGEKKEAIRAVAFVLPPDYAQTVDLEEMNASVNKIPEADKILIVDHLAEQADNLSLWCARNGFELIEMNPLEASKNDYIEYRENYGAKRLDEVLQTADWPNKMKVEKRKSPEQLDKKEEENAHEFKPIQAEKEETNGQLDLGDADELVDFIMTDIPMPKETRFRTIVDPSISKVLKHELDLVKDQVYSLTNAENKLHYDSPHYSETRLPPNSSGPVTSTAEIENSTSVVFSTANEIRASSCAQTLRESSSYSETKTRDSYLVNNGNQVAQASILITQKGVMRPQRERQETRIYMEVDTSTSTTPNEKYLDMTSVTSEEISKWKEGQAAAEERKKPLSRHEYFAKLEEDYDKNDASGVSGLINSVSADEAAASLDFSTYLGNVEQVREALQGQQRQQRADTAGAVAAAIFNSITLTADTDSSSGLNGDSTTLDKDSSQEA